MFVWQRTCVDEFGNILPNADVSVTDVVSGALAQLYADSAGGSAIGNPIVADAEGFVRFYVKSGVYDIVATLGGDTRTWEDEAIGSPHKRTESEIAVLVTPDAYQYAELNVKRYGAAGDGITNDVAAIEAAFDVVEQRGGGDVFFPRGTYKINTAIAKTFSDGITVRVIGDSAVIDGSAITGSTAGDTDMLRLGGARGSSSLLNSNATEGDEDITVADSLGAAANSIILLTSTDLWNPTRAYYFSGEIVEVRNVASSTNYELVTQLFDSYTAANTTAHLLSMPTIIVEGLELIMDANQIALAIDYSKNPIVRNCKVHGARYTGVSLDYCYGGVVEENDIFDSWYTGTGTSYGVAVLTAQGVVVRDNLIREARHGITTGGQEPARFITHANNTCFNHPDETGIYAIDAHGNCEFVKILDNFCEGIGVSSINTEIRGNKVTSLKDNFAINILQEIDSDYYVIADNVVELSGTTSYGVWYSPSETNLSVGKLVIKDNYMSAGVNAVLLSPRAAADTGCSIAKLIVDGNILESVSAQAFSINSSGGTSLSITSLKTTNNVFEGTSYDAFFVASVDEWYSSHDTFLGDRANGTLIDVTCDQVTLSGAVIKGDTSGGTGDSRSAKFTGSGSGRVKMINCYTENMTYRAEIVSLTDFIERGADSAITQILNTASARLISEFVTESIVVAYGSAAPTGGTWSAGDKVYDTSPSAGGTMGWVCVTGGTPGTWKTFGAIAA